MIKANMIKFGYGTLAIFGVFSTMIIQEVESPQVIGSDCLEKMIKGELKVKPGEIRFEFDLSSINEFESLVNKLYQGETSFEYQGYLFDFSNYNTAAVNVLLGAVKHIQSWVLQPNAC